MVKYRPNVSGRRFQQDIRSREAYITTNKEKRATLQLVQSWRDRMPTRVPSYNVGFQSQPELKANPSHPEEASAFSEVEEPKYVETKQRMFVYRPP